MSNVLPPDPDRSDVGARWTPSGAEPLPPGPVASGLPPELPELPPSAAPPPRRGPLGLA